MLLNWHSNHFLYFRYTLERYILSRTCKNHAPTQPQTSFKFIRHSNFTRYIDSDRLVNIKKSGAAKFFAIVVCAGCNLIAQSNQDCACLLDGSICDFLSECKIELHGCGHVCGPCPPR